MIGKTPIEIELDANKPAKGININQINDSNILFIDYLRALFDWTVDNQHFELVMSICTRLEVFKFLCLLKILSSAFLISGFDRCNVTC